MKKIWITSLDVEKDAVQQLMQQMRSYGLQPDGHFWKDDLEKMAWFSVTDSLFAPEISVWVIAGSGERFKSPETMYGLSLLAISVKAKKGKGFPIVILQTEGDTIESDSLPTVLKDADVLSIGNNTLMAKLVAKVHTPLKKVASEYRLDFCGNEQLGQWLELGPVSDLWKGALFGVNEGKILFQAVGKKGELPKTSTLNFPVKDMKIQLGETAYTAWALQNDISADDSYFVKIEGHPETILFGPYAQTDDAEVYIINLK